MADEGDGKLLKLQLAKDHVTRDLKTSLETVRKLVDEGCVRTMATVVTYDDGSYDSFWSGLSGPAMHEKVGLLGRLKHDLLHSGDE